MTKGGFTGFPFHLPRGRGDGHQEQPDSILAGSGRQGWQGKDAGDRGSAGAARTKRRMMFVMLRVGTLRPADSNVLRLLMKNEIMFLG
jgi:hypothetical protein